MDLFTGCYYSATQQHHDTGQQMRQHNAPLSPGHIIKATKLHPSPQLQTPSGTYPAVPSYPSCPTSITSQRLGLQEGNQCLPTNCQSSTVASPRCITWTSPAMLPRLRCPAMLPRLRCTEAGTNPQNNHLHALYQLESRKWLSHAASH